MVLVELTFDWQLSSVLFILVAVMQISNYFFLFGLLFHM